MTRDPTSWLFLVYRIPREPTKGRVYVWRKLKQLGAISVQDAAWTLPATRRTEEQFRWLAAEISEQGGEVTLWTAQLEYEQQAHPLREQFDEQAAQAYAEVLDLLKKPDPDLAAASKRYQQAQAIDFFHHPIGRQVRAAMLKSGD